MCNFVYKNGNKCDAKSFKDFCRKHKPRVVNVIHKDKPNDWLLRIRDGTNFKKLAEKSLWQIVSEYKCTIHFLNNVKSLSKYFLFKLNKVQEKYPNVIKQIRGRGFLIGIQLYKDQTEFIKKLMNNQLLTIRAAENVVRILPPLNVKKNELDLALKIIEKVCSQIK